MSATCMKTQRQWLKLVFILVLLSTWTVTNVQSSAHANDVALEHQVKSDYLYNFPKFVRWPEAALDRAHEVLTICVIGHAEMRVSLYKLENRQANGHNLKISFRDLEKGLAGCQIVYMDADSQSKVSFALTWCRQNHVLTVGDQPNFIELGGVIAFTLVDDRVQLVISRSATLASGLQISAKLMELAQVVD